METKGFVMRYRDEKFGEDPKEFNQSFEMKSERASLKDAREKAKELMSKYREQARIAGMDKKFILLSVSPA